MKPLRIALTKGRLEKDTVNLLEQIGLDCTQVREKGRRLILPVGNGEIEVVLAKLPMSSLTSKTACATSVSSAKIPSWKTAVIFTKS